MTAEAFDLHITDAPSPEACAAIGDGLRDFNLAAAGYVDSRPLAVLVAGPGGGTVGGLLGRTTLGLLFIDLVYLPEALRGGGIGGRMLVAAEAEARRRGCTAASLYTIVFQAPGFYERHGYRVVGRIDCDPPGHSRLCMSKRLVES